MNASNPPELRECRYRVVRQGFWYRVAIGTGTRTVGKFWSQLGACMLADELRCAYEDGRFVANQENIHEWAGFQPPPSADGVEG